MDLTLKTLMCLRESRLSYLSICVHATVPGRRHARAQPPPSILSLHPCQQLHNKHLYKCTIETIFPRIGLGARGTPCSTLTQGAVGNISDQFNFSSEGFHHPSRSGGFPFWKLLVRISWWSGLISSFLSEREKTSIELRWWPGLRLVWVSE
jgi:hypothetical protein